MNAYLVEGREASWPSTARSRCPAAAACARGSRRLGKPLAGVLVTHAHPDHYGGLVELVGGDDVPIFAAAGVGDVIRRDDPVKEQILRPMFGDEWPRERAFPNRIVADGERSRSAGSSSPCIDLGPGESPHDSVWLLGDDRRTVFSGDQAYDRMHGYLADGFHEQWLEKHRRALRRELPGATRAAPRATGSRPGPSCWTGRPRYIATFVAAVRGRRLVASPTRPARRWSADDARSCRPTSCAS